MYELKQVGAHTYYMDCPSKVGFYETAPGEVVLIDSGSDKEAAKKAGKILDGEGWHLQSIFVTHSHADHIGGNAYLQERTGCKIYACGMECALTNHPILEPTTLYGGHAPGEMECKFLLAKPSAAEPLTKAVLPDGLEPVYLPGHSYDMTGYRTKDDVLFVADSLAGEETIRKYRISFLYDVAAYMDSLEKLCGEKAACFVPSHAEPTGDIVPLASFNLEQTKSVADTVLHLIREPMTLEALLEKVFSHYGLTMNLLQRMLVGSTIKGYLSYWSRQGALEYRFKDNQMQWLQRQ